MWQSTLCLGACWLLYWLVLRRETCFQYNRQFLRFTPWLALLLPQVLAVVAPWLSDWWSFDTAPTVLLSPAQMLPTVAVASAATVTTSWWAWLPLVYGAGVAGGLLRLGWQLLDFWRATRELPREARAGYTLVLTGGQLPTSSFGRVVLWDDTTNLTPTEAQQVLQHELEHVWQGHTADLLLLELVRALLWFIPFVHYYPGALALTHEYLADAAVLRAAPTATPPSAYVALLARLALRQQFSQVPLTHYFTRSPILTRIAMLQSSIPVRRWKQWLILPVSAVLLVTISCEKAAEPTAPTASATAESQPAPPPPPVVYQYVEQMPEYEGGISKLLSDIQQQVRYPAVALNAGLEGKVFVEFIVASDGSIQAIALKKGITAPAGKEAAAKALDEAALTAVRTLPGKWTPGSHKGKQVAVSYIVPITFALQQTQVKLPNQKAVSITYPAQQQ
jgi:TonB family protein